MRILKPAGYACLAAVIGLGTLTIFAQAPVIPPAPPAAPVFSKVPGNEWPPARKATQASPALTPQEEMQTFSVPPG